MLSFVQPLQILEHCKAYVHIYVTAFCIVTYMFNAETCDSVDK
jgi:hypothetical protein